MSQLSPISRKEHFLSRAAGGPGLELEPVTREEHFLAEIAKAGPSPGPGGEVTPASVLAAMEAMTQQQADDARAAIYAAQEITESGFSMPDVEISPEPNTLYRCGELSSLTITNPPATGSYIIIFVSGSTPTVLTVPSGLTMPDNFAVEANTRYEINVLDGYALCAGWAVSA